MRKPPDKKQPPPSVGQGGGETNLDDCKSRKLVAPIEKFKSPSRGQPRKEHDARRLSQEIEDAFPRGWSENTVAHHKMQQWRDELLFRIWKHKVLLHRIGCVGPDWEMLVDEVNAFTFANEGMKLELDGGVTDNTVVNKNNKVQEAA